jgi:membrane protein DedA with SNARE-associated domain
MNHTAVANAIHFVERFGYALVFVWVLAEQAALPIPSIPLLIAVGALVRGERLNAAVALASCAAGSLIADSVWFYFGRRRGKRVLRFLCRISISPDSCVRKTEKAFQRYGLNTLLVAKFVPGLNAVAAPLAGDSGIGVMRFIVVDTLGILIWSGAYIGIGYLFAGQLELAFDYVERLGSGLLIVAAGLFAAWIFWKWTQRRKLLKQLDVDRITPEELRERMDAGEALYIVDVSGGPENEPASLAGALRISPEELAAAPDRIPRDREIILYCS